MGLSISFGPDDITREGTMRVFCVFAFALAISLAGSRLVNATEAAAPATHPAHKDHRVHHRIPAVRDKAHEERAHHRIPAVRDSSSGASPAVKQ